MKLSKKNKYLSILICFFFSCFPLRFKGVLHHVTAPRREGGKKNNGLIIECPFHLSVLFIVERFPVACDEAAEVKKNRGEFFRWKFLKLNGEKLYWKRDHCGNEFCIIQRRVGGARWWGEGGASTLSQTCRQAATKKKKMK